MAIDISSSLTTSVTVCSQSATKLEKRSFRLYNVIIFSVLCRQNARVEAIKLTVTIPTVRCAARRRERYLRIIPRF